jgi:hypothetical protein
MILITTAGHWGIITGYCSDVVGCEDVDFVGGNSSILWWSWCYGNDGGIVVMKIIWW